MPTIERMRVAAGIFVTSCALLVLGCGVTRPMANHGIDVIENPGRTFLVRGPAAFGAAAGYVLAVPISVCLLPTYFFEDDVVDTAQGYGEGAEKGDIYVPFVLAPYDYGGGIGAAVFGWPFERIEGLFGRESPGPPPYTVRETQEPLPGRPDPEMEFRVKPPVGLRDEGVGGSFPESPGAEIEGDEAVEDPALEPKMPGEAAIEPWSEASNEEYPPDLPESP